MTWKSRIAALLLALDLRRLQEAGEKLARGDYAGSPALSRWALPDLRAHADHLGSVGAGVQRAVEERMKSEHLKTELITNVSHDIKTPITCPSSRCRSVGSSTTGMFPVAAFDASTRSSVSFFSRCDCRSSTATYSRAGPSGRGSFFSRST